MEDSSKKTEPGKPVQTVDLDQGEHVQTVDMVNSPNHYAPNGVDSFMHMEDQMGADAFRGFLQGNVIKYVQRYQFKGKPVEDLAKAAFYLFHLVFDVARSHGGLESVDAEVVHLLKTLSHSAGHYGIHLEGKA